MLSVFKNIFGLETEEEKQQIVRDELNEIFNEVGISEIILESTGKIYEAEICPFCDERNPGRISCKSCNIVHCNMCIDHQFRLNENCGRCHTNLLGCPCDRIYKVNKVRWSNKKYFCAQCLMEWTRSNLGTQGFLSLYSWWPLRGEPEEYSRFYYVLREGHRRWARENRPIFDGEDIN